MAFEFKHHIIDTSLPHGCYAQTALADLDNDGRLEYVLGRQYGEIYWYEYHSPDTWSRHLLGEDSPSDVGGCVLDVDGDGMLDFVAGGVWYRNSQHPDRPFERIVFDPELTGVHDLIAADIDGDGRQDIVTMSDRNTLRWYRIPDDPTQPWTRHDIGPPVHAGASVGDVDGDGRLDVVRTDPNPGAPGRKTASEARYSSCFLRMCPNSRAIRRPGPRKYVRDPRRWWRIRRPAGLSPRAAHRSHAQ